MIYVSTEFKEAFLSAEQKNLILTFEDGTVIDNNDIALENMELEQTLCDNDELLFGKVPSACFKTKIKASTKKYKNLWFNASIGVGENEIQLGRFKIYTDNMTSDRLYREIVAYDSLFWATNTDVTEWYNGLTFPITQKEFRDSLFDYLGIEQEEVELPNDSIVFNKTVDVENLTGLTVLQKLCELNATWGVINNVGKFKYARMRTHEHDALYPRDDLFPSDTLYPNDIYDARLSKADYYQGTLKYEEYDTQPISKVTIREDSDDLGYSYGTDGNTYVIESNFLLYGASDETLETVAKNFYSYASYIAYTPSELKCKGAPWREVGDLLRVVADKRVLTIPILNRRLSGITAIKDIYIAKGKETYGEVINSPTEQLKQLQSRANRLTRTLDETRLEITKIETNLGKNYSTTEEMNSAISVTAESINTEVSKKVGEDEVVSKINQSADTIILEGNRIIIESDNWTVNEDGSQTCKNIDIIGGSINLSAESSTIAKITVTNSKTGQSCKLCPGVLQWYDENGNMTTNIYALLGQIALSSYDSDGNLRAQSTFSPIGASLGGSLRAQTVSINDDYVHATPLYVNGDAQILGVTKLASSPVISSDRDLKKDIKELTNSSSFIYSLKPCKYRYKNGTSGRFHHGFIAQEVKESMGEDDWGVFVEEQETQQKGIRYEELIADLVATIQEQNKRIIALEEKVVL